MHEHGNWFNKQENPKHFGSKHLIIGFLVVGIGVILLINQVEPNLIPFWIISWPSFMIALGILIGFKSQFRNPGWLILTLLGTYFLGDRLGVWHGAGPYLFPVGVIIVGVFILFRSVIHQNKKRQDNWFNLESEEHPEKDPGKESTFSSIGDDVIDSLNIFGGTKKRIFSKNFRGGEIANFFGGTEIDLTQGDLKSPARIELTQMFGGTKLVIPSNWAVKDEVVSIFGGVSDKRNLPSSMDVPEKIIVITGICIFAGVEIRSY